MTPHIISLNPKPSPQATPQPIKSIPQTTPDLPKPAPSTPKLLDRTQFPAKIPKGTRPAKREPGQEELEKNNRTVRPTSRSTQPDRTSHLAPSEVPQTSQPRTPSISAELERRFRNLELKQKNLVEQVKKGGELECLAVSKNGFGQHWITVAGTGKPFVRMPFASPGFCHECAVEIEENFEILQVIELRPGETMERIEEMIGVWLERERVAGVWG